MSDSICAITIARLSLPPRDVSWKTQCAASASAHLDNRPQVVVSATTYLPTQQKPLIKLRYDRKIKVDGR